MNFLVGNLFILVENFIAFLFILKILSICHVFKNYKKLIMTIIDNLKYLLKIWPTLAI